MIMKEYFDVIIELAKGVNSVWTFLTFFILVLIIGTIVLYKKNKQIFNKIVDRLTGDKSNKQLIEISNSVAILAKEMTTLKTEVVKMKTAIDKGSWERVHNKKITKYYDDFCSKDENTNIDKKLLDIFKEGIRDNKEFFAEMISLDLEQIDTDNMFSALKRVFRTLRASNLYDKLELTDEQLLKFKNHIKLNITTPLIKRLTDDLRTLQLTKVVNGELILAFSKLNMTLIISMLKQTGNYYENLIK